MGTRAYALLLVMAAGETNLPSEAGRSKSTMNQSRETSRRSPGEIWHIASFDQSIRSKVALELLASWPIPDRQGGSVGFWFFYYASFGPPPRKEFSLYPPSWVVWIAPDGTISQLRRLRPPEVALSVPEGESFATYAWPSSWTIEESDEKRNGLLRAYAQAVVAWELRPSGPSPADGPLLVDFRRRFLELTPSPLLPCYRALGGAFFKWIGF
jgi:hypothetical protein